MRPLISFVLSFSSGLLLFAAPAKAEILPNTYAIAYCAYRADGYSRYAASFKAAGQAYVPHTRYIPYVGNVRADVHVAVERSIALCE